MNLIVQVVVLAAGMMPLSHSAGSQAVSTRPSTRPAAETPRPGTLPASVRDVNIRRIFFMVNQTRRRAGRCELAWNERLARAAERHAADMVRRNYFDHRSPEGYRCDYRASREGYRWTRVGENIAKGQDNAFEAMEDWLNSPPHRGGILNPAYRETGISYRRDASGTLIWVEVFAKPKGG
jgi:uncharacterized protein YkwD